MPSWQIFHLWQVREAIGWYQKDTKNKQSSILYYRPRWALQPTNRASVAVGKAPNLKGASETPSRNLFEPVSAPRVS